MKITMVSNAMSHHQKPFCDSMAASEGVEFRFVATKELSAERMGMGYSDLNRSEPYIIRSYESDEARREAMEWIGGSDFVIYGSAPYSFIKSRLRGGKWTFLYSERVFKKGLRDYLNPKILVAYWLHFGLVPHRRVRLLCASAYTAKDFRVFGYPRRKAYRWGYFPKACSVPPAALLSEKEPGSLVWVARMIPMKHPETMIALAEALREKKNNFHLTMVGNGQLLETMRSNAEASGLADYITFTGALSADEVRHVMERSEILVATSDRGEGWGAVINEGMSSCCAVVASREMGAAPVLIRDGENGLLFSAGDVSDLTNRVAKLLRDPAQRQQLGRNAGTTIQNEWNGERACEKLLTVFRRLQAGEIDFAFPDGVCSRPD